MQRRVVVLLASAVAVVAGFAAPAAAQAVPGLSATLTVPSSTTLGVSVQATAVFTPPTPSPGPLQVAIRLFGGAGSASLSAVSPSGGELTNCTLQLLNTQALCDWTPAGGGPQTLTVTIDPVAVGAMSVAATGALQGGNQTTLDSSTFVVLPEATTTTTTTTLAPTTGTSPTTAAVAPTSAAATTSAGTLPASGGSDANAYIALVVLALGAFLVIIARKFRAT